MSDDLDALERLCNEAWPPPWVKFGNTVSLMLKGGIVHTITLPGDHQTLAFIAASRTAVPELITRVRTLQAESVDLRRRLEEAEAREAALRKTLSVFADRDNWITHPDFLPTWDGPHWDGWDVNTPWASALASLDTATEDDR